MVIALGIVVGGLWAYRIFFLGGGASAHIQIQLKLKQVMDVGGRKGAMVSIRLKNLGRTSVKKPKCRIGVVELTEVEPLDLRLMTGSLGESARWSDLFETEVLPKLEPNEEAAEDILITLNEVKTFKAEVQVTGSIVRLFDLKERDPPWSLRAIMDVRTVEEGGWVGGTSDEEEDRA